MKSHSLVMYVPKSFQTRVISMSIIELIQMKNPLSVKYVQKNSQTVVTLKDTLSHTKEKPFVCYVCSKGFSRKDNLNVHLRTHAKEKSFICDMYSKGFSDKRNLNVHLRSHTNDKTFICKVCRKGFSTNSKLRKHAGTHSYEK